MYIYMCVIYTHTYYIRIYMYIDFSALGAEEGRKKRKTDNRVRAKE